MAIAKKTVSVDTGNLLRTTSAYGAIALCTMTLFVTSQAHAQTPAATQPNAADAGSDGNVADIIVTGTSLRGSAPVGTQPVLVGADQIQSIAPTNTSDMLRTIPQINNVGSDETRTQGAQGASQNNLKAAGVNLRSLGATATLLLVNGHRVQPTGTITAFYDPNIMPSSAVDRIEVLLDGASSVYGSDAVAGVVNLITKKNYNGIDMGVRYGWAKGWDQVVANISAGRKWDTGSAAFSYEYNDRSRLSAKDTKFITLDFRPFGGPDRRSNFAAPGNIVVGTTRYAIPAGQNGQSLTPASFVAGTTNLYDALRENNDFLPRQRRHSGTFNLSQEVSSSIELTLDAFYSRRDFNALQAGNGQGTNSATINVPNTNPYFVSPIPGATSVRVDYQFQIPRPTTTTGFTEDWSATLGGKAQLGGSWVLDGFASYSQEIAATGFDQFLNGVVLARIAASSDRAVAFNPFCDPNAFQCNSDAILNSFLGVRRTRAKSSGWQFVAKVSGDLFELPGGTAKLAVGVEYNDNKFAYFNEATNNSTNTLFTVKDINLGRQVKSAFAELALPVIDRLMLSGAVRVDDYSDFGSTTNPRFGATFDVVDGLKLRGSYSTAFRAPSLTEKSDAGTNFFIENVLDPNSSTGTTRALYATGGNARLGPESATTWSIGADLAPRFLSGFRASATYYSVRYKNLIRNLVGLQNSLLASPGLYGFAITQNPTATFLAPFLASPFLQTAPDDPANIKAFLDLRSQNLGGLKQDGIDFSASYQFAVGAGRASVGVSGAKVLTLETQNLPSSAFLDTSDIFGGAASFNLRADAGWQSESFGANLFMNYVGSYTNNAGVPGVPLDTRVPAWTTFDATLRYSFGKSSGILGGVSLIVSAKNIFDRDPPVVLNSFGAFDSANANLFGRIMSVELRKSF